MERGKIQAGEEESGPDPPRAKQMPCRRDTYALLSELLPAPSPKKDESELGSDTSAWARSASR
jgi:hypothetical protein